MPPTGYRKVNLDGSRNVHCSRCFQFICTASAMSGINTALCIVCQSDDEGVDLTQEQVNELRTVMIGGQVVSHTAAYPQQIPDPMTQVALDEVDSQVGRLGYFVKALVKNMRAAVGALIETIPESKKVAKEKRRPRVFNLPLDDDTPDDKFV